MKLSPGCKWNKSRYNDGTLDEIFNQNPNILCIQELHQKPNNLGNIVNKENNNNYFYPIESKHNIWGVATNLKLSQ